jgi:hypothetical protein
MALLEPPTVIPGLDTALLELLIVFGVIIGSALVINRWCDSSTPAAGRKFCDRRRARRRCFGDHNLLGCCIG